MENWTVLIDEIVSGKWINPETGKSMDVDYESIVFEETLDGREADLVASLKLGNNYVVVADSNTYDALGERIVRNIQSLGRVDTIILDRPHADLQSVDDLRSRLAPYDGVIAVGSGTVNDLCKYATFLDGKKYCVFATAASMNGYTSSTASINVESGLKVSLPAQCPKGFFVDLGVSAKAPPYLAAAGFADCCARSVAQVDWWMSHRLLGTDYWYSPYLIQEDDEIILNNRAGLLPKGDVSAIGSLYRVLTLCGLGIAFTGVSNHGSMGEHQISHYIDCFAGDRHPGTLHGQQVGVASLTMARLQQGILAKDMPPVLKPTVIDFDSMCSRMGNEIAAQCKAEWQKKALDQSAAYRLNERLEKIWPELKEELGKFILPVAEMKTLLSDAQAPLTSEDLGLPVDIYREAVRHNHEMRNRYSFIDLAADSGLLEEFSMGET